MRNIERSGANHLMGEGALDIQNNGLLITFCGAARHREEKRAGATRDGPLGPKEFH